MAYCTVPGPGWRKPRVTPELLSRPTPGREWNLRMLLEHAATEDGNPSQSGLPAGGSVILAGYRVAIVQAGHVGGRSA